MCCFFSVFQNDTKQINEKHLYSRRNNTIYKNYVCAERR